MIDLKGKVALLTASGQGIGKATAKAFTEAGAYVIATDINHETLSSLDKIVDETHILDVTDNNEIKKLVRSIREPDILFNCAGVVHNGTILESSDDDWDFAFNLNGKAMYHMIKEVIPIMIKKGGGSIVNIASHYGLISPDPRIYTDCARRNSEVYGATKAGIIQMTKYFSVNALADGANIRVNAVAPGGIKNHQNPQGEDFQKNYGKRCPMGRLAETKEIASPVLYLLSEDASYINGHTLVIDGGMTAW